MNCPWCGKPMEKGYLEAQKGDIWWLEKKPGIGSELLGPDPHTSLRISDEGALITYKTAWWCRECQKLAVDIAGVRRPLGCPMDREGES